MNDYKELIGDIGDLLIAHPSEILSKRYLKSAADAIEQLVRDNEVLTEERDAAIADLDEVIASTNDINWCLYCKHREADGQCHHFCVPYSSEWGWEWRGVQE